MRISAVLAVPGLALVGALLVPYAFRHDRPAKEAFVYEAPPGFEEATGETRRRLTQGLSQPVPNDDSRFSPPPEMIAHPDRRAWIGHGGSASTPPRIVMVHADRTTRLDEDSIARIAADMVEHQRGQGMVYTTEEMRVLTRDDGARVGLVTWHVESAPESPQPATLPRRTVQLTFPDNTGVSIVTAQFMQSDAPAVQPLVEASVASARGVAFRAEPWPLWMRLGLGVLFGTFGWALARWSERRATVSRAASPS